MRRTGGWRRVFLHCRYSRGRAETRTPRSPASLGPGTPDHRQRSRPHPGSPLAVTQPARASKPFAGFGVTKTARLARRVDGPPELRHDRRGCSTCLADERRWFRDGAGPAGNVPMRRDLSALLPFVTLRPTSRRRCPVLARKTCRQALMRPTRERISLLASRCAPVPHTRPKSRPSTRRSLFPPTRCSARRRRARSARLPSEGLPFACSGSKGETGAPVPVSAFLPKPEAPKAWRGNAQRAVDGGWCESPAARPQGPCPRPPGPRRGICAGPAFSAAPPLGAPSAAFPTESTRIARELSECPK